MEEEQYGSLTRRVLVSIVLAVVLLGAGAGLLAFLYSLREPPPQDVAPPPRTAVRIRPAERVDYREQLTGYGTARALQRATVSAEAAGRVVWHA